MAIVLNSNNKQVNYFNSSRAYRASVVSGVCLGC